MGRTAYKQASKKRDGGAFLAVPLAVLDSAAYHSLSASAVKLLWDVYSQYKGDNNGRLYCAWVVMAKRGWKSEATLDRAKKDLLASSLVFETRKGARPNKAAWYAVTWLTLDSILGMDVTPSAFPRGAYRHREINVLTTIMEVCKAA